MSHFYGTVQGNRSMATRSGHKRDGLSTNAAGHDGSINVYVWYDPETGKDLFEVRLIPWRGSGGISQWLASGTLNAFDKQRGE